MIIEGIEKINYVRPRGVKTCVTCVTVTTRKPRRGNEPTAIPAVCKGTGGDGVFMWDR